MKYLTLKEIKQELNALSKEEVQELCLRLSRFKKENKELLAYLLFESKDEAEAMLIMEQNPVVFITTQGWDIEVKKSEITVVSRERKNLIF